MTWQQKMLYDLMPTWLQVIPAWGWLLIWEGAIVVMLILACVFLTTQQRNITSNTPPPTNTTDETEV